MKLKFFFQLKKKKQDFQLKEKNALRLKFTIFETLTIKQKNGLLKTHI